MVIATGIVYYVAMSSIDVIGVIMAGWGSNNKYSLIGGLRSAAQMISYELPLVLALVGVVMLTSALAGSSSGYPGNWYWNYRYQRNSGLSELWRPTGIGIIRFLLPGLYSVGVVLPDSALDAGYLLRVWPR